MLGFPPFAFEAPTTMERLLTLAAIPGAKLLAGGTDLLPNLKHRLIDAELVVSLNRVAALGQLRDTAAGLEIGATVTLAALARHPVVLQRYPALAVAAKTVATSTIQAMATLGGNVMLDVRCTFFNQPEGWRESIGGCLKCEGTVCHVARTGTGCYAAHSADTVPVLWLMGAELVFASTSGTRTVGISKLYEDDGIARLSTRPGEVLTTIVLPPNPGAIASRKVRQRPAIDYPAVLVAVRRDGDGASAVLSAIGPRPIEVNAERADDLPELAWRAARPLNTHTVSTSWRKHMVRVEVRRALASLGD
jgi:4-hydroxybenzoyl-CoA reductase subunit beta